jgi:hypothetical protein
MNRPVKVTLCGLCDVVWFLRFPMIEFFSKAEASKGSSMGGHPCGTQKTVSARKVGAHVRFVG